MNPFKKLFRSALALAGLGLALVALPADAQMYGSYTLTGLPAEIAVSTTTNVAVWIDMRANRFLSLTLHAAGISNVTSVLTLNCCKSVDGINAETTASWTPSIAFTHAGQTTNHSIDVGAAGWVKIIAAVNSTNYITNWSIIAATKPGS